MKTSLGLGLGLGKTPRAPSGGGDGVPSDGLLVRSGDALTDRSGNYITYR